MAAGELRTHGELNKMAVPRVLKAAGRIATIGQANVNHRVEREDNMAAVHLKKALAELLLVGGLFGAANPIATASAGDSSPYLIGHWKLHDVFSDFKAYGFARLATPNTEFVFLNPTNLALTLEYALLYHK